VSDTADVAMTREASAWLPAVGQQSLDQTGGVGLYAHQDVLEAATSTRDDVERLRDDLDVKIRRGWSVGADGQRRKFTWKTARNVWTIVTSMCADMRSCSSRVTQGTVSDKGWTCRRSPPRTMKTRRLANLLRRGRWPWSPEGTTFGSDAAAQGPRPQRSLVLDEPTDLPEGEVVYLQLVDAVVTVDGDDLDDEERPALHRELDASMAEADAGETEDFATVLAELRRQV
jgi:hypothetical protein